jgi:imidazolonepropionase-like amidohydrolase
MIFSTPADKQRAAWTRLQGKLRRMFFVTLAAFLLTGIAPTVDAQQIAVRGETVYTMAGQPIKDGVVLIRDGKIEKVGTSAEVSIPAGYRTLTAKVVTPGMIDAHSVVGLSGYLNQPNDQDQLERSSAMQPELRAIDAYNSRERLVEWLRSFGITTIHTGHGPGALISGQTMIIKTIGDVDDGHALLNPSAMIAVTLGNGALAQGGKPPGTRSKEIAMLRADLLKAREYVAKQTSGGDKKNDDRKGDERKTDARRTGNEGRTTEPQRGSETRSGGGRGNDTRTNEARSDDARSNDARGESKASASDLHMEAMARVIRGEIPLLVTVNRANDILSALRVAKEFNIRVVLDGATEAYLVTDQIKAANVPVIIHPTMARAAGETDNLSLETASTLRRAGIPVALQSGFEGYVPKTRVVLYEAAMAAANGLSFTDALGTITIDAARILGINKRVGSLEAGKDGDVALFDGDPFEYTSHVTGVVIDGRVVSEEVR